MSVPFHHFDIESEVAPPAELDLELPLTHDFARKWDALHRDAAKIAAFAQFANEKSDPRIRDFPQRAAEALAWNRALAARSLDDLAAVLTPGLLALRLIEAEGRDPTAAAVNLWREFHRARSALLDLVEVRAA